jgi:XTP/dITP diphosphohydrolase
LDLIVLATRNAGKARELNVLLHGISERIESLAAYPDVDLPPEIGSTYRENAIAKARAVYGALGLPAVGDDSGLEVGLLGGRPGIHSARYAGLEAGDRANNRLLLEELHEAPPEFRTAWFHCALALVRAPGEVLLAEGVCEGRILEAPRGHAGFGYDPLFLPDGESFTFAELPPDRKNRISHRARAAAALHEVLRGSDER